MSEIKNLGQLINHLAQKAGLDTTDQNLVNILSSSELSKITVHSDLVKHMDENLLSIGAAKDNHPVLKNLYHAQALNAFDKKMETIIEAAGFDEDTVNELKNTKSSYARFELLQTKLQQQIETKTKAAIKPEDKTAMQKQVDDLLQKLSEADTVKKTEIDAIKAKHLEEKLGYELASVLGAKKTTYDNLPPKTRTASLMEHINNALQAKSAKFDFDENGGFTIINNDGTTFVGANHQKYTPQSFIDEILAQEKLVVVSEPPKKTPTAEPIKAGPDAPKGNNQKTIALNNATIKALEEASS